MTDDLTIMCSTAVRNWNLTEDYDLKWSWDKCTYVRPRIKGKVIRK